MRKKTISEKILELKIFLFFPNNFWCPQIFLSSKILELKDFFSKISYFPQILLSSKILELKKNGIFFPEQFLLSQKKS